MEIQFNYQKKKKFKIKMIFKGLNHILFFLLCGDLPGLIFQNLRISNDN